MTLEAVQIAKTAFIGDTYTPAVHAEKSNAQVVANSAHQRMSHIVPLF